jgi:hypothetical protein
MPYFGVPVRNGIAIGLGTVISLAGKPAAASPPAPTISVLDSAGTSYTVPLTVFDSSGTSYTVSNTVLSSGGTAYNV